MSEKLYLGLVVDSEDHFIAACVLQCLPRQTRCLVQLRASAEEALECTGRKWPLCSIGPHNSRYATAKLLQVLLRERAVCRYAQWLLGRTSIWCMIMGLLAKSTIGLGTVSVSGRKRVP